MTQDNDNLQKLKTAIQENDSDECKKILEDIKDEKEKRRILMTEDDESPLHTAIKHDVNLQIIEELVLSYPDSLINARESSDKYRGQTPLHIAIAKQNETVVKRMLSLSAPYKTRQTMLTTMATGHLFINTVMMGELPLSVAALTFNKTTVCMLIDQNVDLDTQNSRGDTVLHSLVRYSAVYPDKVKNAIAMLEFLNKQIEEKFSDDTTFHETPHNNRVIQVKETAHLWNIRNSDNLTPLQLSVRLGVVEIFQFIVELQNVYSFIRFHDGLFDIKEYDITEIDTVANQHVSVRNERRVKPKTKDNFVREDNTVKEDTEYSCSQYCIRPETESILEMLFHYSYPDVPAYQIIQTVPVKNIVAEKWGKVKYIYFVWGFLHLLICSSLTAFTVLKSDIYATKTLSNTTFMEKSVSQAEKDFVDVISGISFGFGGILYIIVASLLVVAKLIRLNARFYLFHNLGYILFLITFAISLLADFIMTRLFSTHNNIALIVAVITGWCFAVFFIRAIQRFSFFTEMIKRVLFGDLLRFGVIILFMLFGFTSGMYATFVGHIDAEQQTENYEKAIEENFSSFGTAVLTMFKLMLGLGDIEVLNEARLPGLAIVLYVIFALITYVILINSLIAMMSQTCSVVHGDRYAQWRLQQLSVILFLEDIFCYTKSIQNVFGCPGTYKQATGFDPFKKKKRANWAYFFQIHYLGPSISEEDRDLGTLNTGKKNMDIKADTFDNLLTLTRSLKSGKKKRKHTKNKQSVAVIWGATDTSHSPLPPVDFQLHLHDYKPAPQQSNNTLAFERQSTPNIDIHQHQ